MVLTGKQKAAMLLMTLDASTAAKLLKGIEPKVVEELAVELSYLDAAGYHNSKTSLALAKEFYNSLQNGPAFELKGFLKTMLENTVGQTRAVNIQAQIQNLLQKRDPFFSIRSYDSHTLASVLSEQHPQAIAVVLSALSARKSSEILGLLDDRLRLNTISRMTDSHKISKDAHKRIAETVYKQLESFSGTGTIDIIPHELPLRKVAVILRNLDGDLRAGLLKSIAEKDNNSARKLEKLMILWEDIPQITNRCLREALRVIDSRKLALALVEVDDETVDKIRSNLSERAAESLEEELSLVSFSGFEEISQAREEFVEVLRLMYRKGQLIFIEE